MAISLVQPAVAAAGFANNLIALGSDPVPGSKLLLSVAQRTSTTFGTLIDGWTQVETCTVGGTLQGVFEHIVQEGEDRHYDFLTLAGNRNRMTLSEWAGIGAVEAFDHVSDQFGTTSGSVGPITPTAGLEALLYSSFFSTLNTGTGAFEPGSGFTSIDEGDSAGFGPSSLTQYKIVPSTSGSYSATATINDSSHEEYWGGIFLVFTEAPFEADFVGVPTSGDRPLVVAFTDLSTPPATSWEWDFGDGSTSTDQNPTHLYSIPGIYTVTLIAAPSGGVTDEETKVDYITVTVPATPPPTSPPAPGVWIDWNNDGFANVGESPGSGDGRLARMMPEGAGGLTATVEDDITSYVMRASGSDGGQFDAGSGQQTPGQFTIIARNDDGRFSPRNASSPYFGLLIPGKKVWIGGESDGTVFGQAAGFIKEIVPLPRVGQVQIVCHDPLAKWQKTPVNIEFAESRKAEDYRRLILTQLGVPDSQMLISGEPDVLYVSGVRTNDGFSALEQINQALGTRHWIQAADNKNDHFYYVTGTRNENLGGETPVTTFDQDDITEMSGLRSTVDTVFNVQKVTPQVGPFLAPIVDLWTSTEVPFGVSSTETKVVYASLSGWGRDVTLQIDSEGSSVTSIITNYGQNVKIEITSAGASTITNLILKGRTTSFGNRSEAVARSLVSINAYGFERESSSISTDLLNNTTQAQGVAEALLFRSKDPRDRPSIKVKNRFDKALLTRIGDVVEASEDELFLDGIKFEVIGRNWAIDNAAKTWDFGFTLLETPIQTDLALFTLNQSLLDGTDVLGF